MEWHHALMRYAILAFAAFFGCMIGSILNGTLSLNAESWLTVVFAIVAVIIAFERLPKRRE